MEYVFLVCAALGGTVLVIQFLLTLIGLGGHGFDVDMPHDVGQGFGGDVAHDFGGDAHDAGGDLHGDAAGHHAGHAAAHHGSTWLFGVISFRTLVAALAFFGLAGLAADAHGASTPATVLVAVGAGVAAMFGVYWMMQGMKALRAEGTVRLHRAIGSHATVYLKVPGRNSGTGKIQLNLQNRTMEYLAMTSGQDIPTGAKVVVVGVLTSDTVAVEPVSE